MVLQGWKAKLAYEALNCMVASGALQFVWEACTRQQGWMHVCCMHGIRPVLLQVCCPRYREPAIWIGINSCTSALVFINFAAHTHHFPSSRLRLQYQKFWHQAGCPLKTLYPASVVVRYCAMPRCSARLAASLLSCTESWLISKCCWKGVCVRTSSRIRLGGLRLCARMRVAKSQVTPM